MGLLDVAGAAGRDAELLLWQLCKCLRAGGPLFSYCLQDSRVLEHPLPQWGVLCSGHSPPSLPPLFSEALFFPLLCCDSKPPVGRPALPPTFPHCLAVGRFSHSAPMGALSAQRQACPPGLALFLCPPPLSVRKTGLPVALLAQSRLDTSLLAGLRTARKAEREQVQPAAQPYCGYPTLPTCRNRACRWPDSCLPGQRV